MFIQKENEQLEKELLNKIDNVIVELSDIESQFCSYDETSKGEVVFKARELLLEGFVKDLNRKQI